MTFGRFSIKSAIFYFKQDIEGKIWFLWGSSIVFDQEFSNSSKESFEKRINVFFYRQ